MLGIVLPGVARARRSVGYVSVGYVLIVVASDKVVVVIDIDVVTTPAPSAIPAPTTTPCRSHGDSYAKRNSHAGCVVSRRRIINRRVRIDWRSIDNRRVVGWDIDDFWFRLFDDDDLLILDNLRFDFLLIARL